MPGLGGARTSALHEQAGETFTTLYYLRNINLSTRKHSSRMRTARLPTVHVLAAATNCGQNHRHM